MRRQIVTNAAGALNPNYAVGDLAVLQDAGAKCPLPESSPDGRQHISLANLAGINPLRGSNAEDFGVRFPALSDAYDLYLRSQLHKAWQSLKDTRHQERRLHEGIYAFVGGPR